MAYENIPNMSLHLKDGGLLVPVIEGPVTDSLLIIGTAVDGPSGRPIKVNSQTVEQLFGPVIYTESYAPPAEESYNKNRFNGNTLVKAYYEASLGGCADIYLLRVGGAVATAKECSGSGTPAEMTSVLASADLGFSIDAIYPGAVYNNMLVTITVTASGTGESGLQAVTMSVAQSGDAYCTAKKGTTLTYSMLPSGGNAKRMLEFMSDVNGDSLNRSIRVTLAGSTELDTSSVTALAAAVSGDSWPSSGTTRSYYYRLTGGANGTRMDTYKPTTKGGKGIAHRDTNDGLYDILLAEDTGAFEALQSIDADIVYLSCIYADENVGSAEAPVSVINEFAKALHRASVENYPMCGILGVKPLTSFARSTIVARVSNLTAKADVAALDSAGLIKLGKLTSFSTSDITSFYGVDEETGAMLDYGRYVQVAVGPDVIITQNHLGTYVESPAGVYAGFLTTLPLARAATNLPLPGIQGLAYEYTRREVNKLAGGQPWNEELGRSGLGGSYIVLRTVQSGQAVINLDNTCAARASDYSSYQVFNIVNSVASGIKRIVTEFIGEPNHTATRAAMRTQIKGFLDDLAETKAIGGGEGLGYEFTLESNPLDTILGRVRINLTLRPALQIKEISVTISVAPPVG